MGGQQSQSQPGVKVLGVSGGGGGFGKIAEALAVKVSFDTNTGAVSVTSTSPDGNAKNQTTFVPDDKLDLGQYIDFVTKNMKAGQLQNPGVYPMTANMMAFDAIGTQVGGRVDRSAERRFWW